MMEQENEDLRVLLIDDEPMLLRAIARLLQMYGVHVTTCNTGSEALEALSTTDEAFDLIVCDVKMPGQSGPEVVRKIRNSGYEGLVVFYSGDTDGLTEEVNQLIRENLVTCLLEKPLEVASIRNLALLGSRVKRTTVVD